MATVALVVNQFGESASRAESRGHTLVMDRPEAKGGHDQGMMGGEAMLSGLGGCFMSNLLAAAKARDITLSDVQANIQAELAEAPARFTAVNMRISGNCSAPDQFAKLVTIAERGCIAANTLRNAVELTVSIE